MYGEGMGDVFLQQMDPDKNSCPACWNRAIGVEQLVRHVR